MITFQVLGAVQVLAGSQQISAGPPRQRAVLAVLLAEAGRPVSWESLIDRVWGDQAPRTARESLYAHVTRLRQVLRAAGEATGTSVTVASVSGGYLIDIDADHVDAHRFHRLVGEGRRRGLTDEQRVERLREALRLWRGEPFAGVAGSWAERTRENWRQEYLDAVVSWAEAELRVGNPSAVVAPVTELAGRHPFAESLAAVLMRALAAIGRPADALSYYADLRRNLADELGTDPGAQVQAAHRDILAGRVDVRAHDTDPEADPGMVARPVPAQLPGDVAAFTGRAAELASLSALCERPGAGWVRIAAIAGAGGMGKTWLAVHWAHQNIDRFPDGQLFVNLRGFDPSGQPTTPTAAVRGFLDALGVPPQSVPLDLAAQVGLYRSLVAGRRMLIILDNARDAAQVVDLLPGTGSCVVLTTSRDRLTGLLRSQGARPVLVDTLDDTQARTLLAHRLGDGRLAAEPDAVDRIVAACSGMPLALGIVAARAALSPHLTLAAAVDELGDATTRLTILDEDDPQSGLRAVLSWSHAALAPGQARAFALLGLAPGPDIGLPATAALLDQPADQVGLVLRALQGQSLLAQPAPGRWRMHDLVRLYAAERARNDSTDDDRRAALRRVVEFYLRRAYAAARSLNPHPPGAGFGVVLVADGDPTLDAAGASAWLDAEYPSLLASQQVANELAWHEAVWQFAWSMDTFQRWRGLAQDQIAMWNAGLSAARQVGNAGNEALCHRHLGRAYGRAGLHTEAAEHLHRARVLAEQDGDVIGLISTHLYSSWLADKYGDEEQALRHATAALDLSRTGGHPVLLARALNSVGWCLARVGEHARSRVHLYAALAESRRLHLPRAAAETLDSLGYLAQRTGDYDRALEYYRQALALTNDLGDAYSEATFLEHLGETYAAIGDQESARGIWLECLRLYRAQHRTADVGRTERRIAESLRGPGVGVEES